MNFESFEKFYSYLKNYYSSIGKNCLTEAYLKDFYDSNCKSFNFDDTINKIIAKDYVTGIEYDVFGEKDYFYMIPLINDSKIDSNIDIKAFSFSPTIEQVITIKSGNLIIERYYVYSNRLDIELYDANALKYIIDNSTISYKDIFELKDNLINTKIQELGLYPDITENIDLREESYCKYKKVFVNKFIKEHILDDKNDDYIKLLEKTNKNIEECASSLRHLVLKI